MHELWQLALARYFENNASPLIDKLLFAQGWGMVDGMHAVVFVDNHDNQV